MDLENIGLACLSGLMFTASFPPINLEWIAWISFVPLCMSLQDQSLLSAFKLGLIAGLSHYLTLVYWIVVVLSHYGNIPLIPSLGLLFLLAFYLGLYLAVFALLFATFPHNRLSSFFGASIWVVLEYTRSHIMTGFPWCLLGYSQYLRLPLIQIAAITGVYGISFVIVLVNLAIYKVVSLIINRNIFGCKIDYRLWDSGYEPKENRRQRTRLPRLSESDGRQTADSGHCLHGIGLEIVISCILIGFTLFYGYRSLNKQSENSAKGRELRAVIAQGNIDQSIKWNKDFQQKTVDIYYTLSVQSSNFRPHLIIWPETAVPFFFQDYSYLSQAVYKAAKTANSSILFGSPAYEKKGKTILYYNRAYVLSKAKLFDYYDKVHLLPFGEYVPLKKYLPFVHRIVPAAGDFTPGTRMKPIDAPNLRIGALICYEAIFPDISRKLALQGADLLVNITNDAWFGRTSAPYQHLSMAVLRCVETHLPMARAANTGISAFILANGKIVKKSGLFSRELLEQQIQLRHSETFYSQFGDIFVIILITIMGIRFLWTLRGHYHDVG